jgi:N-acylneuraminate cytidylyltransferase
MSRIVAIIPARGGSKRLHRKNIYPVCGTPMIFWPIDACKNSKYIDSVYVSSEDNEILEIAESFGANKIRRPAELSGDLVYKQEVIVHATTEIMKSGSLDVVISLQANSPQVKAEDLDAAIEKFMKFERDEIFSVDKNLMQNAAFRIMKADYVFQKTLSTNCGVFVTDYIDIHTLEDVKLCEELVNDRK